MKETKNYTIYPSAQLEREIVDAHDNDKCIEAKRQHVKDLDHKKVLKRLNKKHVKKVRRSGERHASLSWRQKVGVAAATIVLGSALFGATELNNRYNAEKSHDPDLTRLGSAEHEIGAAATAVIDRAQDIAGNKVEAGGTYKIKRGEKYVYDIAADLIAKYKTDSDIGELESDLKKLNSDLINYPPQPGVKIKIPSYLTGTTLKNDAN